MKPYRACQAVIVLMWLVPLTGFAQQPPLPHLKALKKKIDQLSTHIIHQKHQKATLEQQLAHTEKRMGHTQSAIQKNRSLQEQLAKRLAHLRQDQALLMARLKKQQRTLAEQLRAAYLLAPHQSLKILLDQQQAVTLSRNLIYYRYFIQSRNRLLTQLEQEDETLKRNQHHILDSQVLLNTLQIQLNTQKAKLKFQEQHRQHMLTQLSTRLKSEHEHLAQLRSHKQHLERIILQIQHAKQIGTGAPSFFGHLQHKLAWPVKGQIVPLYGRSIAGSEIKWDGVLIQAPEGRAVHAVAPGQIVFSQWLAGYGLLIIINHGHGYMSLYGRNQVLLKSVGAEVSAGDVIAEAGKSGGYKESSLYFALKYQGQPISPFAWCQKGRYW